MAKPKQRLTPTHWTEAAMDLLAESGIGAVSIDRLADRLGVTRGSFYHHFSDREALLKAVLTYWAERWTYAIRDQIAILELDPSTTLLALMKAIRRNKAADNDAPIRAWALHDPMARQTVQMVDEVRLGFIRKQFEALGFEDLDAENRARLFLYYELSHPIIFAPPAPELDEQLLVERHRFLVSASIGQPTG